MTDWKVDVLIAVAVLAVVAVYGVYVVHSFGGF